ncbi:MAG: DNA recombination protein RecN [Campylobacterota bacterium]|nr:DNA recombination protein RecN [Campylobacterota bacterium]
MITRFYLQDFLSFKEIDLEFNKGLIVFTGPSGAGKSIFMSSILSLIGATDTKAKLSEVTIEDLAIENENYSIAQDDDIIIKQTTNTKTRYLLNNQSISKKNLKEFAKTFSKHLHLKDVSDFNNDKIINFIDYLSSLDHKDYDETLNTYLNTYKEYKDIKNKLIKIEKDQQDIEDLKEYAKFEIDKIAKIDPKVDEYDELKDIKTNLSKKDKLQDILDDVMPLLNNTHKISHALQMLEVNSDFFDDTINEVNNIFEKFNDNLANLEDIDIEEVLNRIEQLSGLNKRFGGIEEALEFKKTKEIELERYENISFEKSILEKNEKKLSKLLLSQADTISKIRKKSLAIFETKINEYLKYLYLENLKISINKKTLDETGIDEISFTLNNIELSKISSGEFNRLRLALLTARSFYEINTNGILFLDEIDANLSGKESQSIAKVLEELSKNYQIFAISHQPQLSATASQHFMVLKTNNNSTIKLLNKEERVDEIARMISGEDISPEALEFAKKLLY